MNVTYSDDSIGGQIIPGLITGVVTGAFNVIFAISLAALIFTGELAPYVANGIGFILLGAIPPLLLISLFSSYRGNIAVIQDAPAAILAVMATGMMQRMASSSAQGKFITILAAIIATTVLTGLFFLLFGRFNLGSLVRFLPYPVVGGFLAGTGWLLVIGGIGVMSDISFTFANFGILLQPDVILRWAPGIIFAAIMLFLLNRYDHFLILPGLLLGIFVLFYATALVTRTPISTLGDQGWLLGPFTSTTLWQPIRLSDVALIQWDSILAQVGSMASILMISVVSLLLNASGIELTIRRDLDLNRELRVTGLANVAAGLLGGIVSFHGLTDTAINFKTGKGSRLTSWVAAALHAVPLIFGVALLSFVPKIALGAMLAFLGVSFLYEWVYLAWFDFSRLEYVIILGILIAIATLGFLQGVGIGIVAAVGLFVINYSQVDVTKHMMSGAELQSRCTRTLNQQRALVAHGDKSLILQLQGFIFFGTANKMLEQIRERIGQAELPSLQYLVLDFERVSGLDSTAMLSFSKMKQVLEEREVAIVVTAATKEILMQLEKGGFVATGSDAAMAHSDLDHGLEWVENRILNAIADQPERPLTLREMFYALLADETRLDELFRYLEKIDIAAGEYLMRQADAPDNMYFIESGQVTAQLEYPDRPPVRLESMKSGRVIGEIGFYLGQVRTAAVVADEPSIGYVLTTANLAEMERRSPETASYFHQLIIQLMAQRTTHLIRTVAALEK